jgi:hypothetical protein
MAANEPIWFRIRSGQSDVSDLSAALEYAGGTEFALARASDAEADIATYLADIEQTRAVVAGLPAGRDVRGCDG